MSASVPLRRKHVDEIQRQAAPTSASGGRPSRPRLHGPPLLSRLSSVRFSLLCIAFSFLVRHLDTMLRSQEIYGPTVQGRCRGDNATDTPPLHLEEERLRSDIAFTVQDAADPGHVQVLQLVETLSARQNGKKLVALVELRNVEDVLPVFLRALTMLVDSIVVLDDHSTDRSRVRVMEAAASYAPVEILITKTGEWVREEMLDRNLLLRYGRFVGGTHFVLPDYDEYFSANCLLDGSLRAAILALGPGQSLVMPWVEAWKSTSVHRVLPSDPHMNFLTRRQTIIFADDGYTEYNVKSSNSRPLGTLKSEDSSDGRDASIHVLRCPRSLCPAPTRYYGPGTPLSPGPDVKTIPHCRIIELRFLSTANVLLKAAWYEALGRVMGADDSVARGKMLDAIFPVKEKASPSPALKHVLDDVVLARMDPSWLQGYTFFDESKYNRVELWRAKDIVRWQGQFGESHFHGLSAYSHINVPALSAAVRQASGKPLLHVPQHRRRGTFVIALEADGLSFLDALHSARLSKSSPGTEPWFRGSRIGLGEASEELRYERWRAAVLGEVHSSISQNKDAFGYCSTSGVDPDRVLALVEMLIRDAPDVDVVVLSVDQAPSESFADSHAKLREDIFLHASAPGSNLRLLITNSGVLGSLSGISILLERLVGSTGGSQRSEVHLRDRSGISIDSYILKWERLIAFAENRRNSHRLQNLRSLDARIRKSPPVARLVFSLNVGRSGSKYLASILESTDIAGGILSLHEPGCPDRYCSGGGAVRMQSRKLSDSYDERMAVKLKMIRQSIAKALVQKGVVSYMESRKCSARPLQILPREIIEVSTVGLCTHHFFKDFVYAEMNPNFKSWLYDIVLDTMPAVGYFVDVVVLRRYIPAVIQSLLHTGYFTSRDGYNWMETANSVNSIIRPLDADEQLDACDKVISYVLNAEAVTRHVMQRYSREARFVEVRSEEIFGKGGTLKLLNVLGLIPSEKTLDMAGTAVDKYAPVSGQRFASPRKLEPSMDLRACEQRVASYFERCNKSGIHLPDSMGHMAKWPGFQYQ